MPSFVFHFVTLFPDTVTPWMTTSILGRAREKGLFDFKIWDLREFAKNKHRSVDDVAYGGGGGMVLKVEPLVAAVEKINAEIETESQKNRASVLAFTPAGSVLNQNLIEFYSKHTRFESQLPWHFVLICGHYEGIDQRFLDHWVDQEISLGDFVLTGGELPALAFADAMTRTLEGSLGNEQGAIHESFKIQDPKTGKFLLEYPHYTRPEVYQDLEVPKVLLSGNHEAIKDWRLQQAVQRTTLRRPDLLYSTT